MHPLRTMRSYLQAISPALRCQIVSALLLAFITVSLNWLATKLMLSMGHVAITTGDFAFLFTSWQGIAMIVLALVSVYVYVGMDINAKVAFAGRWVRGDEVTVRKVFGDGLYALRRFVSPGGFLLVLYVAAMVPLVGFGFSISLTKGFRVPSFVTSVISANPLFTVLYLFALLVITAICVANIFSFHGVVLDDMTLRDSVRQSMGFMRRHWLNFFLRILGFLILESALVALVALLLGSAGLFVAALLYDGYETEFEALMTIEGKRFVMLFTILFTSAIGLFVQLLTSPFFMIKMTKLYEEYSKGERVEIPKRRRRLHPFMFLTSLAVPVLCAIIAFVGVGYFDEIFPATYDVKVIAHRACGNEGYENTVEGLAVAEQSGAWGAEIDIQRTSDGAYVVNHDDTFERVAGDERTPSDMTLAEVKQLKVKANPVDPTGPGVPVSTYEEMLDGARDHNLILFVELKGKTADRQMADDAVRIATERGVIDRCVFISLKYDLIKYLEETNPDVKTGYLAFASYGQTADIPCDYLALEEQVVKQLEIGRVHDAGKSLLVWTVNDQDEQAEFLATSADAIITDNMSDAAKEKEKMEQWSDQDRVKAVLKPFA